MDKTAKNSRDFVAKSQSLKGELKGHGNSEFAVNGGVVRWGYNSSQASRTYNLVPGAMSMLLI